MKFILFLLLTLQLTTLAQSQVTGVLGGQSMSPANGTAITGGSQAPTTDPTTPTAPSTPSTPTKDPTTSIPVVTTPSAYTSDTFTPTTPIDNPLPSDVTSSNNGGMTPSPTKNHDRTSANTDGNNQGGQPTTPPSSNGDDNTNSSQQDAGSPPGDNTGKIAGGVVGGIVALALIGGLLTWLNRRGGCTSRTKPRNQAAFEEFAMKDPEHGTTMGYNDTASPFQRRMAPMIPQTTGYMNLGHEDFSDTSTAVPMDPYGGGYKTQQQPDPYYFAPQQPNHQMKPDTIDHKPNEL
ncbi:hypothetical protein BC941DRAFT_424553 [Chlamydoabsidia padenii]|nr:hypothetical protein BC941DRAFT_424553 [Chlamydoabsidia padenii]